ncbi:hypothetical protein N602_16510 [Mycobacterium avium subsp. hominissuis 10-5606]|nr:hypothetical protein N602_16510 [Mycobacterium avium subsp. hominissuis 10-5606]
MRVVIGGGGGYVRHGRGELVGVSGEVCTVTAECADPVVEVVDLGLGLAVAGVGGVGEVGESFKRCVGGGFLDRLHFGDCVVVVLLGDSEVSLGPLACGNGIAVAALKSICGLAGVVIHIACAGRGRRQLAGHLGGVAGPNFSESIQRRSGFDVALES